MAACLISSLPFLPAQKTEGRIKAHTVGWGGVGGGRVIGPEPATQHTNNACEPGLRGTISR